MHSTHYFSNITAKSSWHHLPRFSPNFQQLLNNSYKKKKKKKKWKPKKKGNEKKATPRFPTCKSSSFTRTSRVGSCGRQLAHRPSLNHYNSQARSVAALITVYLHPDKHTPTDWQFIDGYYRVNLTRPTVRRVFPRSAKLTTTLRTRSFFGHATSVVFSPAGCFRSNFRSSHRAHYPVPRAFWFVS